MTRCKSMNPKNRERCYKAKNHKNRHEDLNGDTWKGKGAPTQERYGPPKGKGGRPKKVK